MSPGESALVPPLGPLVCSTLPLEGTRFCHVDEELDPTVYSQCRYIGNRTLLRCTQVVRCDELTRNKGICELHSQFSRSIKRRHECEKRRMEVDEGGKKTKHAPVTRTGDEISDEDETLLPMSEWVVSQEDCTNDSQRADDDNPLRRAGVFTEKELLRLEIRERKREINAIKDFREMLEEKACRRAADCLQLRSDEKDTQLSGLALRADGSVDRALLAGKRYKREQPTGEGERMVMVEKKERKECKHGRLAVPRPTLQRPQQKREEPPLDLDSLDLLEQSGEGEQIDTDDISAFLHELVEQVASSEHAGPAHTDPSLWCTAECIPASDFCIKHILDDANQRMFVACSVCERATPDWNDGRTNTCFLHTPMNVRAQSPLPAPSRDSLALAGHSQRDSQRERERDKARLVQHILHTATHTKQQEEQTAQLAAPAHLSSTANACVDGDVEMDMHVSERRVSVGETGASQPWPTLGSALSGSSSHTLASPKGNAAFSSSHLPYTAGASTGVRNVHPVPERSGLIRGVLAAPYTSRRFPHVTDDVTHRCARVLPFSREHFNHTAKKQNQLSQKNLIAGGRGGLNSIIKASTTNKYAGPRYTGYGQGGSSRYTQCQPSRGVGRPSNASRQHASAQAAAAAEDMAAAASIQDLEEVSVEDCGMAGVASCEHVDSRMPASHVEHGYVQQQQQRSGGGAVRGSARIFGSVRTTSRVITTGTTSAHYQPGLEPVDASSQQTVPSMGKRMSGYSAVPINAHTVGHLERFRQQPGGTQRHIATSVTSKFVRAVGAPTVPIPEGVSPAEPISSVLKNIMKDAAPHRQMVKASTSTLPVPPHRQMVRMVKAQSSDASPSTSTTKALTAKVEKASVEIEKDVEKKTEVVVEKKQPTEPEKEKAELNLPPAVPVRRVMPRVLQRSPRGVSTCDKKEEKKKEETSNDAGQSGSISSKMDCAPEMDALSLLATAAMEMEKKKAEKDEEEYEEEL